MPSIRIKVNVTTHEVTYEVEGAEEDILQVTDETLTKLNQLIERVSCLSVPMRNIPPQEKIELEAVPEGTRTSKIPTTDLYELHDRRLHLGSFARELGLRDLILLAMHVHSLPPLSREKISSKEIYQFLVGDGFPITYKSVRARVSEATRDGTLIKMGEDGYRLSRKAEDRLDQIISEDGTKNG